MGYIPALFVVFSGGLLWGLVVYNNLKTRIEHLRKKIERLNLLIIERNAAIQAVLNEATPSELGDFIDDPFVKIQTIQYNLNSPFLAEESKVKIWLKDFIHKLKAQSYDKESLSLLSRNIAEADRGLIDVANAVKHYNLLVEAKPTSFMASMLGFKRIDL